MKLYFGKADANTSEEDKRDLFYHNGNYFYFLLEVEEDDPEDIVIRDTCNRSIPLPVEDINNLVRALSYTSDYLRTKKYAQQNQEYLFSRLARVYGLA